MQLVPPFLVVQGASTHRHITWTLKARLCCGNTCPCSSRAVTAGSCVGWGCVVGRCSAPALGQLDAVSLAVCSMHCCLSPSGKKLTVNGAQFLSGSIAKTLSSREIWHLSTKWDKWAGDRSGVLQPFRQPMPGVTMW